MSDIEVRDRLRREIRKQVTPTPGNSHLTLLAFAVGAGTIAFGMFLLLPRFLPETAALPGLKDVKTRIETKAPASASLPNDPASVAARYAGKSPEAMGRIADEVCLQRANARYPNWTKTPRLTEKALRDVHLDHLSAANELALCLVTEAPERFCSSADRNMLSAEIVQYFLAIAHLKQVQEKIQTARSPNSLDIRAPRPQVTEVSPDPKVIAAIEARLNDGHLTGANRDQFNASVPSGVRERFARIKPRELSCMEERPWWAFWR
jgi:hypothetical protein